MKHFAGITVSVSPELNAEKLFYCITVFIDHKSKRSDYMQSFLRPSDRRVPSICYVTSQSLRKQWYSTCPWTILTPLIPLSSCLQLLKDG